MHNPNIATYRPYLGRRVNEALVELVKHKNATALVELSVTDYLEKMIAHWWMNEFPDKPVPHETKAFHEDLDFVQSA